MVAFGLAPPPWAWLPLTTEPFQSGGDMGWPGDEAGCPEETEEGLNAPLPTGSVLISVMSELGEPPEVWRIGVDPPPEARAV